MIKTVIALSLKRAKYDFFLFVYIYNVIKFFFKKNLKKLYKNY